jgi:ribosomal protein S18 acetylase RimI-like enzyme
VPEPSLDDAARAARDWRHALHASACDILDPWEHGTIVRATRFPNYFDYNLLRVERDPQIGFSELTAIADRALDGLAHRRIDFDLSHSADRLRPDFTAAGWDCTRLLWMEHRSPAPPHDTSLVHPVDYDLVNPLRHIWHQEDFDYPETDGSYFTQSRDLALSRGARVLAVIDAGEPIAFAELIKIGDTSEITDVYVHPRHRGRGLGTAVTCAAIAHAGDGGTLYICADDEDRPKELYRRLGFVGVWTAVEFLRVPA